MIFMKFLGNINRNLFSIKNNISTRCERSHVQVAKDPHVQLRKTHTLCIYKYRKIIHFTFKNVDFFWKFGKNQTGWKTLRNNSDPKKNYFLIFVIKIEYILTFFENHQSNCWWWKFIITSNNFSRKTYIYIYIYTFYLQNIFFWKIWKIQTDWKTFKKKSDLIKNYFLIFFI